MFFKQKFTAKEAEKLYRESWKNLLENYIAGIKTSAKNGSRVCKYDHDIDPKIVRELRKRGFEIDYRNINDPKHKHTCIKW